MIFTSFLENGNQINIIDYENGSTELVSFLTSASVLVSSDLVNTSNNGPARVYAPSTYDQGSSYHIGTKRHLTIPKMP